MQAVSIRDCDLAFFVSDDSDASLENVTPIWQSRPRPTPQPKATSNFTRIEPLESRRLMSGSGWDDFKESVGSGMAYVADQVGSGVSYLADKASELATNAANGVEDWAAHANQEEVDANCKLLAATSSAVLGGLTGGLYTAASTGTRAAVTGATAFVSAYSASQVGK